MWLCILLYTAVNSLFYNIYDFYQMISQNQEAFINMLNDPSENEGAAGTNTAAIEGGGGPSISRAPQVSIQVTPEEKAAIERVCIWVLIVNLLMIYALLCIGSSSLNLSLVNMLNRM